MNDLMQITKPVSFYVDQVLTSIKESYQSPLDIHLNRIKLEKILEAIGDNPQIKESIINEFEKYGNKKIEYKGSILQQQEAGVKYDYTNCGDPIMDEYMKQKEELETKIKERSKFLQNIPFSGTVDPDTGVLIYPPAKSSKTIIKATLK